ncbi:MAG: ATP-binding cassette domain-containing protein [Clostridia bacterium]|jgi:ABC-type multidrug transport system ATPase subunit|nr:ATP-binding cassette domain-containing protein [Clostridia bacterium]
MLSIKNLYLKFTKEFYALEDINIDVEAGESVAFVGELNSGKTTLLRVIAKLEDFDSGEVYINSIPLKKVDYKTDLSLGYVPYCPVFLENKTVYENFKYILHKKGVKPAEAEKMINNAIIDFSLERIRDEKIKNIRKEDKYVLSLIRLSFRKLDMLLVDNIFDEISDVYIDAILSLIKRLKDNGTTLILACTRPEIAEKICKRKIYFEHGKIVGD